MSSPKPSTPAHDSPSLAERGAGLKAGLARVTRPRAASPASPGPEAAPATSPEPAVGFAPAVIATPVRTPMEWQTRLAPHLLAVHMADKVIRMDRAGIAAFIRDAGEHDADMPVAMLDNLGLAAEQFSALGELTTAAHARFYIAAGDAIGETAPMAEEPSVPPAPPVPEPPAQRPEAQPVEPSAVFERIAASTRDAAADALADDRVSPALRTAIEAHRDATLAMLLCPDDSNEASKPLCEAVEASGEALRMVPAQSIADVRAKLAFLLPEILPDVNGATPTAFLENVFDDVERLAGPVDERADADADLLRLGEQFDQAHARWRQTIPAWHEIQARFRRAGANKSGGHAYMATTAVWEEPGVKEADQAFSEAADALIPLCEAIWKLPCTTPAGLAVKARAAIPDAFTSGDYERNARLGADEDLPDKPTRALIEACCALAGVDWRGDPIKQSATDPNHPAIAAPATLDTPAATDPVLAAIAASNAPPCGDLAALTLNDLAHLHRTVSAVWSVISMYLNAPFAWDERREDYGPLGRIIEAEVDRWEALAGAAAKEAARRSPRDDGDRDRRLEIAASHNMMGGGPIDDETVIAELTAAWGR